MTVKQLMTNWLKMIIHTNKLLQMVQIHFVARDSYHRISINVVYYRGCLCKKHIDLSVIRFWLSWAKQNISWLCFEKDTLATIIIIMWWIHLVRLLYKYRNTEILALSTVSGVAKLQLLFSSHIPETFDK